jgi:hypothetical protein
MARLKNMLVSLDQTIFVLVTLGAAWPDETASAAAYRLEQNGSVHGKFWRPVIDWIFAHLPFGLAEEDHCRQAFLSEVGMKQLPPEYSAGRSTS